MASQFSDFPKAQPPITNACRQALLAKLNMFDGESRHMPTSSWSQYETHSLPSGSCSHGPALADMLTPCSRYRVPKRLVACIARRNPALILGASTLPEDAGPAPRRCSGHRQLTLMTRMTSASQINNWWLKPYVATNGMNLVITRHVGSLDSSQRDQTPRLQLDRCQRIPLTTLHVNACSPGRCT